MILRRSAHGPVRAAGGIVWREQSGELELVVVHRPQYDDWSLPKGKVEGDESDQTCALREVEEETGLLCELNEEVATTFYTDNRGRPKTVRWWAMTPTGGELRPAHEVDAARWLPVAAARSLLTYDRDRALLDGFVARRAATAGSG
jgi:8-oxo-dGTP diphosphatase